MRLLLLWYLRVCQSRVVRFEVVDDALGRSGQGDAAHQQYKQHHIWECGCQVHHLQCAHTGNYDVMNFKIKPTRSCFRCFAHLSSGLDSLPDTEVTDEPDGRETQSQLPADWTQFI